MAAKVFKNFIGGEWVESRSAQTYENLNPADTRDVIGVFQRSDKRDVDDAVSAAKQAFERWRLVPAPKRAEIIYRAGEILLERKEEYARLMTREMGKVLKETRGDVQEAVDTAYYMAGGNACVIKPAEDTPLSTLNLLKALTDAGLPKGVVNVVTGFGPEVGAPIAEHPNVQAISFTGSSEVGRIVGETAARSFKPCSLEMGGKNAIIILDDANLDLALEGVLWGAFGTTGQRCTAASRVIVQKGVYRQFADRLIYRAQRLKVGNGQDESVEVGPQINEQQVATKETYVQIGKGEGAKLEAGGKALNTTDHAYGWFFEPTIFTDVNEKMRVAQEEISGPVLSLIPVDNFDKAIEIANCVPYGLSSSVYTRDVNKAFRAMRDIYAGITYVNAPTIGAEVHLPFGGTKSTGNGHREGGLGAIDFYTQWKSCYIDFSDRLQRAQIDTGE